MWQDYFQLVSQCIVTSRGPQKLEGLSQLRWQLCITQCVVKIWSLQRKQS